MLCIPFHQFNNYSYTISDLWWIDADILHPISCHWMSRKNYCLHDWAAIFTVTPGCGLWLQAITYPSLFCKYTYPMTTNESPFVLLRNDAFACCPRLGLAVFVKQWAVILRPITCKCCYSQRYMLDYLHKSADRNIFVFLNQ